MPKGLQYVELEILDKFKAKVAQSLNLSLNSNKNYHHFADFIYRQTHIQVSPSTLRRIFQYDSHHIPTKSTLDLISQSIGYVNWDDFIEKERNYSQFDLSQLISTIQFGGIPNHREASELIIKFKSHPNLFNLLEVIVQAAINKRDIKLLSELFDFQDVFTLEQDSLKIYFFVHNLVINLNKAGLMTELIPYYGINKNAQVFLIEWYVDEDHLDGYYNDLLQVYHKNKTSQESLLFYHCLMYQKALLKDQSTKCWLEFIQDFVQTEPVHPIPRARKLGTLLLETDRYEEVSELMMQEVVDFFLPLNEDDKIITALIIIRLLFIKRRSAIITSILKFAPDITGIEKNIWTRININQLRIYRAFSSYSLNEKKKAITELEMFDPILVNNFIHNIIMNDFDSISNFIKNKPQ